MTPHIQPVIGGGEMNDKPWGEIMGEMDHDSAHLPAEDILADVITTMKHARVFISSREKMHQTGIELYDELLERLTRRRYPLSQHQRGDQS